ncbi:hypothetical protein AAFM48_08060 [Burkholderia pseudomallei]
MISQQHAGDIRAASVPAINVPDHLASRRGRGLAEITQDTAKLTADLVRMKMRRCIADCPMVKARAAIVEAQLAALKTEADEAKRREADEDRWKKALDRNESLRAALRDNSVASRIASWFGTTESKVEFLHAFASAVVLEGAAIVAWMLAAGEQGRRERSVSSGANHRLLAPLTHDGSSPIAQSHGIAAAASEPIATAVEPVAELEMPVGSSKAISSCRLPTRGNVPTAQRNASRRSTIWSLSWNAILPPGCCIQRKKRYAGISAAARRKRQNFGGSWRSDWQTSS